ncbi:two pore channel protein 2-like [Hypomesus transpacificus]|uniref:two pore channel protein 2-like n=1 Tax=Hypomesus transpacificus TaxID=137520 RepID=UPI001F07489F|nr:two pore channel protein 2-like [Hypomesus transpacificus]
MRVKYRSINHRMDLRSLILYRWYFSRPCQWGLNVVITVLLALAFIEKPTSLTVTSDLRYRQQKATWEPPCGLTETIEITCLVTLSLDLIFKLYLIGREEFLKCKWLIGNMVVITVSIADWMLSLGLACDGTMRIRRILRPFFLLQNSSLMKKTLKCIKRTVPEIASVMFLVVLHVFLFTMFAMLLFVRGENPEENKEWDFYFRNFPQSLTSLLVLLTTANNPDVMTPAYSLNRAFSAFFMLFSGFGTFFLMNLVTAIIYNQFRGYLVMSIQTSIARRRLAIRAAFELLHGQVFQERSHTEEDTSECVLVKTVVKVMKRVKINDYYRKAIIRKAHQSYCGYLGRKAFQELFDELDKDRIKEIILVNDSEKKLSEREDYYLETINSFFIVCYLLEMGLKMVAFGLRGYVSYNSNIFDGSITLLLLGLQISIFATYRLPFSQWNPSHEGLLPLWEMSRLLNMLIIFRFLRIIPNIKLMALVASTLMDLVKNLRAFAGILVVVYYMFAVVGIWLFKGVITAPATGSVTNGSGTGKMSSNTTVVCGSYEQLGYWSNNFDDFASALVLLYNIMVVNNWNVFLDVYSRYTSEWSKLYFIAWWLTSSVMWANLFVAFILENFIYKWDRSQSQSMSDVRRADVETTVQLMFRERMLEPTEEGFVSQPLQHPHLHLTM